MGINHSITFVCDQCDSQYLIDETTMEIPPNWFAVQIAVSNEEGYIPEHERENYLHFCSRECLEIYIKSDDFLERMFRADKELFSPENYDEFPPDDDSEGKSVN